MPSRRHPPLAHARLRSALAARLAAGSTALERHSPGRMANRLQLRLLARGQRVDELQARNLAALRHTLGDRRRDQARLEASLARLNPGQRLQRRRTALDVLQRDLGSRMTLRLQQSRADIRRLGQRLDGLSPLAVLERGYAICRRADGTDTVVRQAQQVTTGDDVTVLLHRGELDCRVANARDGGEEQRD